MHLVHSLYESNILNFKDNILGVCVCVCVYVPGNLEI